MDLNKYIKKKRIIVIYDNNISPKFSKLMNTSLNIYKVYAGHVYNPPYFDTIIVSKERYSLDDLKMLWNMVTINGHIIINYVDIAKTFFRNNIEEINNKMLIIKKSNNISYQFPTYRTIDFIIGGTMKGGTTAAITNLNKHPDIQVIDHEIHYYDKKEIYQKGLQWYKSHFNYSKKMVGDKAPDVMYQQSCLELLQITNPQVKIILFLRNPIDRAYSHWKMTKEKFRNKSSFEDSINDELEYRMGENRTYDVSFWHHFIQRGFYYQQIEEILKYFPKDNLLILITEKVKDNMDMEYQKVFKFLELNQHHDKYVEEFISNNPNNILAPKSLLYKKLKKLYVKDVKNLEKFIGYKTGWF